ncbi:MULTISPECIES: ferredoxin [unclassified Mycobacterium]|uniref:ferredoxin n=1 Tax=unclassified Mycobacterium TaxID=2642494 RepID=UPI0029C7AB4C|nr:MULTISPECIES: ferredoxin [unclassified Mycobacterium]
MKAVVDDDRCRGHGVCVAICPEVFTLTDDGYARAETSDVPTKLGDTVTEAVDGCPEHAIDVV